MQHAIEQWLAARECFLFAAIAHRGWRKLTPQELIALLKANGCMQPRRHAYVPLVFGQQTRPCFSERGVATSGNGTSLPHCCFGMVETNRRTACKSENRSGGLSSNRSSCL